MLGRAGAGDGQEDWGAAEQPGERDLGLRPPVPSANAGQRSRGAEQVAHRDRRPGKESEPFRFALGDQLLRAAARVRSVDQVDPQPDCLAQQLAGRARPGLAPHAGHPHRSKPEPVNAQLAAHGKGPGSVRGRSARWANSHQRDATTSTALEVKPEPTTGRRRRSRPPREASATERRGACEPLGGRVVHGHAAVPCDPLAHGERVPRGDATAPEIERVCAEATILRCRSRTMLWASCWTSFRSGLSSTRPGRRSSRGLTR